MSIIGLCAVALWAVPFVQLGGTKGDGSTGTTGVSPVGSGTTGTTGVPPVAGWLVTSNAYDGATSRILTTTTTGSLPVNYFYDEFSFGFSTKYHDREIGMIGYQQRVYSPGLGRWASPARITDYFTSCYLTPLAAAGFIASEGACHSPQRTYRLTAKGRRVLT